MAETTGLMCSRCPLAGSVPAYRLVERVPGCPGPTVIEHVGAVASLEERGRPVEVVLSASVRYCGSQEAGVIREAIGAQNTENRIVDTGDEDGIVTLVVAHGSEEYLTELYGTPARGTPQPTVSASASREASEQPARPQLKVVSDTMNGVHTQLDETVRLLQAADLQGLLAEGTTRTARLANEVDGTSNRYALAMQAAGAALLLDLRAAVSVIGEFGDQVEAYKRSTGGSL